MGQKQHSNEAFGALLAMAQLIGQGASEATDAAAHGANEQTGLTAKEVAHRLAELTRDVLGCQRISITIVEPETGILRPLAVIGLSPDQESKWWDEQLRQESRLTDGPDPVLIQRLQANEVVTLDMEQTPWNAFPNPYGIRSMLVAPMAIGKHLVGFISLDYGGAAHVYSPEESGLAGAVGRLAALVIERERLQREQTEARAREIALLDTQERMDEFLSIVSHELRTPMTTIKGNLQLAKIRLKYAMRGLPADNTRLQDNLAEIEMLLDRAERQVNMQNRLVRDLMDVSRTQTTRLELQQELCDLITIVSDAVQDLRNAPPARTIHTLLPAEDTLPIFADPERIGQAISNYLTNALKYSPADRPVEVRLEKEGTMARLAVRDQGPGLTPSEQERVWERFYQAEGVRRQGGFSIGLGLGLHICRIIIEQHQGQVGVESTKGEGSTFWFTLPLVEDEA
jgi:signal transduction histidine kinase